MPLVILLVWPNCRLLKNSGFLNILKGCFLTFNVLLLCCILLPENQQLKERIKHLFCSVFLAWNLFTVDGRKCFFIKNNVKKRKMWAYKCKWNDRIRKSSLCKDQEGLLKLFDWILLGNKTSSWCPMSFHTWLANRKGKTCLYYRNISWSY